MVDNLDLGGQRYSSQATVDCQKIAPSCEMDQVPYPCHSESLAGASMK